MDLSLRDTVTILLAVFSFIALYLVKPTKEAAKEAKDKTEQIALKFGAKVISDNYQGYGHALKSGIESSNSDIVVLAEADGTFRSSDLQKLIHNLMDNDVVQGTRTNPAYIQYKANMDRPRIFFNQLYFNRTGFGGH